MKTTRMRLGDYLVDVVTIKELAKLCGRSLPTIRRHIERGNLPDANIRTPDIVRPDQRTILGARLYTVELAKKVAAVFQEIQQGVEISEDQKRRINEAFNDERLKYKIF